MAYVVAIAWVYVVGMMALAEATAPAGTLLGAVFTFLLYGVLPLAIVLYLLGTPARKRRARAREAAAHAPEAPAPGPRDGPARAPPTDDPLQ